MSRHLCMCFTLLLMKLLYVMLHPTQASMELLLSPRATVPWLSWQHRCVIHCLLARKQPRLALRYLHWTMPAMESVEDAKLYTDVLLQNRYSNGFLLILHDYQTL